MQLIVVFGVRYSVFGVQCLVFSVRCSVFGVRCLVFGIQSIAVFGFEGCPKIIENKIYEVFVSLYSHSETKVIQKSYKGIPLQLFRKPR